LRSVPRFHPNALARPSRIWSPYFNNESGAPQRCCASRRERPLQFLNRSRYRSARVVASLDRDACVFFRGSRAPGGASRACESQKTSSVH
jgi:hypothetical protein